MSQDPIRLVDLRDPPSPEAELVRDLIRAQARVRPPPGKMEELAVRLGPMLTSGPPTGRSAPWLGLAAAAVATVALVGVTLSMTGAAGVEATTAPAQPLARPAPPPASVDAPPVAAVSVDALPSVVLPKPPAPALAPTPRCDDVSLVDTADTELRAGNPSRALAVAREHEQRCPAGALVQERERIAIEALVDLGRSDQARARARAFEERYPSSPHVGRIRRALERLPR